MLGYHYLRKVWGNVAVSAGIIVGIWLTLELSVPW
jgi:hypothetical protein